MKFIIALSLMGLSFIVHTKEAGKKTETKKKIVTNETSAKKDAPCDSKEDILKKLEEKKKAEASSAKGFSLQGGDTGCSVK